MPMRATDPVRKISTVMGGGPFFFFVMRYSNVNNGNSALFYNFNYTFYSSTPASYSKSS
jgi:hypothetical protein